MGSGSGSDNGWHDGSGSGSGWNDGYGSGSGMGSGQNLSPFCGELHDFYLCTCTHTRIGINCIVFFVQCVLK